MARYSAGAKSGSSVSGSAPAGSIYASDTTTTPVLREVGIFNTTSTACDVRLVRLTSAGTTSAALTESKHDPNSPTAAGATFNYHTVAPSLGDDLGYRASLGAAVGAGVIWSFGAGGIRVAAAGGPSTANGVGIVAENGTLQQVQFYFVWDEG